ncbi:MAG: hypothetical protein ABIH42_09455 [Planctomycetota bacterium]
MAVVETVKIVSKNGYIIINKSDLKDTDKVYEEKKEEEKPIMEEKSYKPKRTKGEKYDD